MYSEPENPIATHPVDLSELIKKCPHIAHLNPDEQEKLVREMMNTPSKLPSHHQDLIKSQSLTTSSSTAIDQSCPVGVKMIMGGESNSDDDAQSIQKCPYQSTTSNNDRSLKASDFKCSRCNAYLVGCMSSKSESVCKYCFKMFVEEEERGKYESDSFKQHLTDSYVEILFERNDPNVLSYTEDEFKIKKIEHYVNLAQQEYLLNKYCEMNWMEKAREIALKGICLKSMSKSNVSNALAVLFCGVSGKLSDMYQNYGIDMERVKDMLHETVFMMEDVSKYQAFEKEIMDALGVTIIKLGDVHLYKLKNYDSALNIYQRILSEHSNNLESSIIATTKIGDLHLVNNRAAEAHKQYQSALELIQKLLQETNVTSHPLLKWIEIKLKKTSTMI